MRKFLYLTIALFELFISCRRSDSTDIIEVAKFEETIKLAVGEGCDLPGFPFTIGLIDSLLIVNTGDAPFIHFCDTLNFKEISNFGIKGKGPNEFIYLQFFNDFNNDKSGIWLFDANSRKLYLYKIKDLISFQNLIKPLQTEFLSPLTAIETSLTYISDTLIIGGSYSNIGQLFFLNQVKHTIRWTQYSPTVKHSSPSNELGQLYFGIVQKKPDCSKTVCVLRYFKRIIINDLKGNKFITIRTDQPEQFFPNANIDLNYLNSLNYMYFDLYCTDRFIYALYLNVNSKQLLDDGFSTSQIQVFDYDGRAKMQILLDRAINNIAVDEINGTIFGLNKFQENKIYKIRLPKELMER